MTKVSGYARLVAAVAVMTGVIPGVEKFIDDVVDKLRNAAEDDSIDLDDLADQLEKDKDRLTHAIVANTPAQNTETVDPAVIAEVTSAGESQAATDNGTSAAQVEGNMSTEGGANTTQDSQLTDTAQVDPAALGDGQGQGVVDSPSGTDPDPSSPPVSDTNGGDSAPSSSDDNTDQSQG